MSADRTIPPRALGLLALLTLLWGTNWPLFTWVLREMSVWSFRAVSLPAAAAVLFAVARLRGQPLALPRRHWGTLAWATALYLVVWNVGSTYAAALIPSGQAAILGYTMPLWVALLAWLVFGEQPTRRLVVGLVLGCTAVGLLMWRSLPAYADAPAGFAFGLAAGLGWAAGTLLLKRRPLDGVPVTVATAWQLLMASVPIAIGAVVHEGLRAEPAAWPSWPIVALVVYITLVPLALGNVVWFSIVTLLPASVAGLSSILVPVVAMLAGALIHGEPLGPVQWAAMVCCAVALRLALGGAPRAHAARPVRHDAPPDAGGPGR